MVNDLNSKVSDLLDHINVAQNDFSILLINPKETFLTIVEKYVSENIGFCGKLVHQEENSVWIIPSVGEISRTMEIDRFVGLLKPRLFLAEINKAGISRNFFSSSIDEDMFDTYFFFDIRDSVCPITEVMGISF